VKGVSYIDGARGLASIRLSVKCKAVQSECNSTCKVEVRAVGNASQHAVGAINAVANLSICSAATCLLVQSKAPIVTPLC
jgi:hypothetical protein